MTFLVQPAEGPAVGLFLDQRENRRRVQECSNGRRVLNTFAYTCGFSLAAAAGGAVETVSVDLSQRSLDWGKRNFAANGFPLDHHAFIRAEIFDYLKRAAKHGRRFDLTILDPPTFARSKRPKRIFQLAADLEPLIAAAVSLLDRKGLLLLNVNARQVSLAFLKTALRRGAGNRRFRIISTPALPPDFATDRDYSKSVWASF